MEKVLIAGMGNVLFRDDGFGVAVVNLLLEQASLPAGVRVLDIGIGGIHLVQELLGGYDALIVVDAAEDGAPSGTLRLLEVEVPDLADWPERDRQDFLADMHYATPSKALILSKALGVLPPRAYLMCCQPADTSDLGIGLSEPVSQAARAAVQQIERLVWQLHRMPAGTGPTVD